ncbi:helicase HerA domain-containing protein, partial [Aliarcobacter butzleri]
MSSLFNPYEYGIDFSTKKRIDGWDPDFVPNPHLLVTGQSGAGKTTFLKDIIDYLGNKRNKLVFVLDIHNGLEVENENYIKYSARNTSVGINPFEFDYDIADGGPNIRAEILVQLFVKHFIPTAGAVIKNILKELFIDTYKYKGIFDYDENTWPKSEIEDFSQDISSGTTLPIMSDLEDVYTIIFNKLNAPAILIEEHIKMELEYYRKKNEESTNEVSKKKYKSLLEKRTEEYLSLKNNKVEGDIEFEDICWFKKNNIDWTKYKGKNVISSLSTIGVYIRTFSSMNIFNAKKPKFNKNINRLDLSGFTNAGKPAFALFFFDLFLQRVFGKCKIKGEYVKRSEKDRRRGKKTDVFIVIDESRAILPTGKEKENPYHMTNKISAESRKYGLGLILGSQRILHYGDEILSNFFTKILLKTDSSDIAVTNKRLKIIDKDLLSLTKYNDVAVIGTGSVYKAVHLDLFQQF